jgi:hypothetical protein
MKRGFNLYITRCIDCPHMAYDLRKCTKADRDFELQSVDKKTPLWCPMVPEERV